MRALGLSRAPVVGRAYRAVSWQGESDRPVLDSLEDVGWGSRPVRRSRCFLAAEDDGRAAGDGEEPVDVGVD